MQIVFINYGPYCLASGVHIHFIANELSAQGHQCTAVVSSIRGQEDQFGPRSYEVIDYTTFAERLQHGDYTSETIFHAWTPREGPRQVTLLAAKSLGARYYVHLEDNERRILESESGKPFAQLLREAAQGTFELTDDLWLHPILHQTFLAEANGVTMLMDTLGEFVPASVPHLLIWPACEDIFFGMPLRHNTKMREQLGLNEDSTVLVYPGNVHASVAPTVAALYRALPLIKAADHEVCLVRCAGGDHAAPCPDAPEIAEQFVRHYPDIRPADLPAMLSMADVLVQPGAPDAFDAYRFPSKLPLFLASGRPVILARTNIGRFLTDGENCRILEENTPETIARHVLELIENPELARKLGEGGRAFAKENFSWGKVARKLLAFYEETQ